ncbi:MAG: hypothetical protein SGPRY_006696, partial [Prymnesium sp.]
DQLKVLFKEAKQLTTLDGEAGALEGGMQRERTPQLNVPPIRRLREVRQLATITAEELEQMQSNEKEKETGGVKREAERKESSATQLLQQIAALDAELRRIPPETKGSEQVGGKAAEADLLGERSAREAKKPISNLPTEVEAKEVRGEGRVGKEASPVEEKRIWTGQEKAPRENEAKGSGKGGEQAPREKDAKGNGGGEGRASRGPLSSESAVKRLTRRSGTLTRSSFVRHTPTSKRDSKRSKATKWNPARFGFSSKLGGQKRSHLLTFLQARAGEMHSLQFSLYGLTCHLAPSTGGETKEILDSFSTLLQEAGIRPDSGAEILTELFAHLSPKLNFSQASIFHKLGERRSWAQYQKHVGPKLRVVVVGGGPIGLRCAIELALLGHSVCVKEKREGFTRLNVLHLWELVEHDLISLGVKILDPSVFSSVDFQHVGTSQLQHSLLKIALLLGVRVELGSPITELQAMLTLSSRPSSREGEVTGNGEDKSPVDRNEFEVLVDATGARCDLFSSIGLSQEVVFKGARAIGVVVHLHNGKTPKELQLREANWAHQFHTARFNRLYEREGVRLQNLVYYRSTGAFTPACATHYFVFTAEAESLLKTGALKSASSDSLCASGNVQFPKLGEYARKVIREFVPELSDTPMVEGQLQATSPAFAIDLSTRNLHHAPRCIPFSLLTTPPALSSQIDSVLYSIPLFELTRHISPLHLAYLWCQIFDFSTRMQSNTASKLVRDDVFGGRGDSQEPFWPEGLGINRGFLHCLDCADLVTNYSALHGGAHPAKGGVDSLLARREELFKICKG